MKRLIIFFLMLLGFAGIYNFSAIRHSISGSFGDASYRKDDFLNAEKHYVSAIGNSSGSTLSEADILYNLGNALYRLGEKEKNEERLRFWKESIGSYARSLSIRTDRETEENLAFVRSKFEKEMKEQEKKKEKKEEKKEEEKKEEEKETASGSLRKQGGSGGENTENTTGSGQQKKPEEAGQGKGSGTENGDDAKSDTHGSGVADKTQSGGSWSNGGSYNPIGGQSKDDVDSELSLADREEIGRYIEELKKFERQNGRLLNPDQGGKGGSLSDQIRDFFGNDSFFQDVLPTNDGKKDW